MNTEKTPYQTPALTHFGSVAETTAAGSGGPLCPDGRPRPPTGSCGQGDGRP